jgi:hypothetical protein
MQRIIKRSDLVRLSATNSPRLSEGNLGIVNDGGLLKQWVGIGWIELAEKPTGKHPIVVD